MDLVLELLWDVLRGGEAFRLAAVNKACATHARTHFEAFIDRLVATSCRLGERSEGRTKAFHADPKNRREYYYPQTYKDREEWHKFNDPPSGRQGVGNCDIGDYGKTPTVDVTFRRVCRDEFVECAKSKTRVTPGGGWWRRDHALCEPMFFFGPINFYKRQAVPNFVLYNAVVHGDRPHSVVDEHQRFFVSRLLQERAA